MDLQMQDLLVYETETNTYMSYFVSGAGSRTDRSQKNKDKVPNDSIRFVYPDNLNIFGQLGFSRGAFIGIEIREHQAILKFYNGGGSELHKAYLYPREIS
uniref:Jacalin-type lectin domain-containing protein n=1 Tax=Strongyloides papillosus TaxID=174720 RepID=A0A0N5BVT6_STREA